MISVVIPAHNEGKYIEKCLKALQDQDYSGKYETIVVDNNSTDNTYRVAQKYADRVLSEKDPGPGSARQTGFNKSRGEIIASTDADTCPHKSWLSEIQASFSDTKLIGVYGPVHLYDGRRLEGLMAKYGYTTLLRFNCAINRPLFPGMNFAARREELSKVDIRGVKFGEDSLISLQLKELGKISFNKKMIVSTSSRRLRANGMRPFLKQHMRAYASLVTKQKIKQIDYEVVR